MSQGEQQQKNEHVVYGDAGEARAREERERAASSEAARQGTLWQALLPLLVGFALLVGLVIVLGVLSQNELEEVRFKTEQEERKLSEMLRRLLDLRLALSKLDTEARIRGQVEAGTKGGMLPPSDLRLRNERGAVEKMLPLFAGLPLKDEEKKNRVWQRIVDYIEITKDPGSYSANGYPAYRDLEAELRSLSEEVSNESEAIRGRRDDELERVQGEVRFLQYLAAITGLVVAAATTFEVLRRFRQLRRGYDALRQERQFSAQMLEGMVSAIAAIDREDRVRSANAAFFEVFPNARPGISIHDDFTTAEGMKLLAAAGQSAAQIAHEIKNPLGSIRLGVAMLRDMARDRESITTIDLVERGIEHLSKLTLDVTQFSRTKRLTLSDVDLHALLDGSLELIFDRLNEKRTPVEKHYTAEPLRGHWDDDQLRQVFVNLVTNALDAGGEGSPVRLTTETLTANAPRAPHGGEGRPAPFARVTIADRGAAMDERTRARIFEP